MVDAVKLPMLAVASVAEVPAPMEVQPPAGEEPVPLVAVVPVGA
jgi:hypothetical protein